MRINTRQHAPWFIFVCLATGVASLLYLANLHPQRMPFAWKLPAFFGETPPAHATIGGTPLGLIFGAVSFAIFIFAALLSLRKKLPLWRIGTVQRWLRAHIWLTLLTVPLILLHSGFALGGAMTTLLMALYAVVMLSGIYGLIVQHQIPRLMKEQLPAEIVFEQIPHIRAQLCASAEKLRRSYQIEAENSSERSLAAAATELSTAVLPDVSAHAVLKTSSAAEKPMGGATVRGTSVAPVAVTGSDSIGITGGIDERDPASERVLVDFLERQLLPYLQARRGEKFSLGRARPAAEMFRLLKLRVAAAYRQRIEEMQGWCDDRRLLDAQTRMQNWLHGWLLLHVPLSFLLLLMTAWHAFVTLFQY